MKAPRKAKTRLRKRDGTSIICAAIYHYVISIGSRFACRQALSPSSPSLPFQLTRPRTGTLGRARMKHKWNGASGGCILTTQQRIL
eukprot:scaffold17276_cov36-Tisochrysis_lutea.AAC.3